MMQKIVHALNNNENALLESPTGSGKSLALLCAALAWRENEERKVAAELLKKKQELPTNDNNKRELSQSTEIEQPQQVIKRIKTVTANTSVDDDDFQKPLVRYVIKVENAKSDIITIDDNNDNDMKDTSSSNKKTEMSTLEEANALKYDTYKRVPRIFIGSRTHKQIAQLVSELKYNTRYRPRVTVLASRDHLCIHPKVSKSNTKSDDCTKLIDENKCPFGSRTHALLSHPSLKTTNRVWDIEDMVQLGKKVGGCPYYAARKLYEGAEVIFAPYNYIIDPVIRKVLDINLKNSIIILDEAHNIEDASRAAGSFEIDEESLQALLKELSLVVKFGGQKEAHKQIELIIEQLYNLMLSDEIKYIVKDYEQQACHWTGQEMIQQLDKVNISVNTFNNAIMPAFKIASNHADMIRKEAEERVIDHIDYEDAEENDSEVKIHRIKCLSVSSLNILQGNDSNRKRKASTKTPLVPESPWNHKLAFWCLNPAILFNLMAENTHSVILTSGTLSPLNTFAAELGAKFTGKLEANHVIKPSQVWVSAISHGPTGIPLKGVFNNIGSLQYQDEVGATLCEIVHTIPYGVLCFLPSYKVLDLMLNRWSLTGILDKIKEKKLILSEPKGGDKREFESVLNTFYGKIHSVQEGPDEEGQDGALMFAVFRGKVSEGIDFSDNYCRAVVTLGIPFPSFRSLETNLKREYNNKIKSQSNEQTVLSGTEWYTAQAYRAINQALGRCIRHKNDWGAIILIDERFKNQEALDKLSKWVKKEFKIQANYPLTMQSLKQFVDRQLEEAKHK
ncbi:helicase C-terminal domain-containing protein [Cokeromyces recurvatus]|uniref:helicase C-terminal domain-containing protein n=1 Tax=Cokeromyces recurvatus TaxID=90255 RepID=UPI002220AE4B|nr:helicase C-terminal domain-containing protein [Cokeromyces recurvatus]KAI7898833.1 helicase C-terminal domain-containing protein [Cokeromyces recurvatus]